ncbi:MAG TPA: TOBE domain-containing protein, partial [Thauera sp.]|nr:TOBE domain-containing protein [Thauera sp.]
PPMKVSARNTFEGTVGSVINGAVNTEVGIDLPSGDKLVAVVTLESARSLQLAPGKPVVALVKAPWVMLMTDGKGIRLSARNCLSGTVKTVKPGAVNAEVVVALPGGTEVVAIVTNDAVAELGLAPGVATTAVIKASNVILGVPA